MNKSKVPFFERFNAILRDAGMIHPKPDRPPGEEIEPRETASEIDFAETDSKKRGAQELWAHILGCFKNPAKSKKKVGAQTLAEFFDHIATLIAAGIPVLQALNFSRNAIKHAALSTALKHVSQKIQAGSFLSESLACHPEIFDFVVLDMLRAAEASGNLEQVCRELARTFSQRAELQSRFLQALSYPALIGSFGILTVFAILTFVVPQIAPVFELWDTPLPLLTRILLGAARFMSRGGLLILAACFLGILMAARSLKPQRRREIIYSFLARVPLIKRLLFLSDLIQLSRTWSMSLRSGVPFIEAVRFGKDAFWSSEIRHSLNEIQEKTLQGVAVEEVLRQIKWFPEMAQSLIAVGQETGTLHQSFEKIASYYDMEFNKKVKLIATYLEPCLILVIGCVVGFLVVGLLLPIFEMSQIVR